MEKVDKKPYFQFSFHKGNLKEINLRRKKKRCRRLKKYKI